MAKSEYLQPLSPHEAQAVTYGLGAVMAEENRVLSELNIGQFEVNQDLVTSILAAKRRLQWDETRDSTTDGREYLSEEEADLITDIEEYREVIPSLRTLVETSTKDIEAYIAQNREKLRKLNEAQSGLLNGYMETYSPMLFKDLKAKSFRDSKQEGPDTTSWKDWLAGSSPELFMNVLQWHTHAVSALNNSPEIQKAIRRERLMYKDALKHGVDAGWLSIDVDKANEKVDTIPIDIGDIFDTIMHDRVGYHQPSERSYIVIQQANGVHRKLNPEIAPQYLTVMEIEDTTGHELSHEVMPGFRPRWANEAMAEHVDLVMKFGQSAVINPADRSGPHGTYHAERGLFETVLKEGYKGSVPTRLATRAYSGGSVELKEFNRSLAESWGIDDVMGRISRRIAVLEGLHKKANPTATDLLVKTQACEIVRHELVETPQLVFGPNYKHARLGQLLKAA